MLQLTIQESQVPFDIIEIINNSLQKGDKFTSNKQQTLNFINK